MRRPPLWATIFTVIGCCILVGLGGWQMNRLQWKNAVIAELQREYATDAANVPLLFDDFAAAAPMKRGMITGRFLHDKEIALRPRTYDGVPGFHIYTPLILGDGGFVLINRGWVGLDDEMPEARPETQTEGLVSVTGMIRPKPAINPFTPDNSLGSEHPQWYQLNEDDLQTFLLEEHDELFVLADQIFYAERESPDTGFFKPSMEERYPNNNHMQYALFWFGMAGVFVLMYVLRFLKSG